MLTLLQVPSIERYHIKVEIDERNLLDIILRKGSEKVYKDDFPGRTTIHDIKIHDPTNRLTLNRKIDFLELPFDGRTYKFSGVLPYISMDDVKQCSVDGLL